MVDTAIQQKICHVDFDPRKFGEERRAFNDFLRPRNDLCRNLFSVVYVVDFVGFLVENAHGCARNDAGKHRHNRNYDDKLHKSETFFIVFHNYIIQNRRRFVKTDVLSGRNGKSDFENRRFRFVEFNFFEDFFEIEKRNMLCILTAVIVILTAAHGIL